MLIFFSVLSFSKSRDTLGLFFSNWLASMDFVSWLSPVDLAISFSLFRVCRSSGVRLPARPEASSATLILAAVLVFCLSF